MQQGAGLRGSASMRRIDESWHWSQDYDLERRFLNGSESSAI